jgi:hypothetical protein
LYDTLARFEVPAIAWVLEVLDDSWRIFRFHA